MKNLYRSVPALAMFATLALMPFTAPGQQKKPAAPKSVRLYILDCGDITGVGEAQFGFKQGQLADSHMITPCYLIVHPRGTMVWDTGEIPDADFKGNPTKQDAFTVTRPLLPQLAALGYTPADINYLALSHYHGDHVANANAFPGSTWIVEEVERNAMFAKPNGKGKADVTAPDPTFYGKLEHSKTILLHGEDHDVFGDGTVVIKFTPGHTPGHQSLFLKFAKTGPVVLSGDLYHYPEERSMGLVPAFDVNADQTRKSRADLEAFIKKSGAQLWIQHGTADNAKLKKAPEYYD
jgi:glyoxylase-like metal-dependent hydrolase (beta-lactamase superfamily II)